MKKPEIIYNYNKDYLSICSKQFLLFQTSESKFEDKTIGVFDTTQKGYRWTWYITVRPNSYNLYYINEMVGVKNTYVLKEFLFDYLSKNYKEELEWLLFNMVEAF